MLQRRALGAHGTRHGEHARAVAQHLHRKAARLRKGALHQLMEGHDFRMQTRRIAAGREKAARRVV